MTSEYRVFKSRRRVRVGDCDQNGIVRVDAIARYLQDIGYDDTDDIGVGDGGYWVARSISMNFPDAADWPKRNEWIDLETFCGGVGRAFAQRIVNVYVDGILKTQASTDWVCVNETGKPIAIPNWLLEAYPQAKPAKAARSLEIINLEDNFEGRIEPWYLRASDLDINGHVNNAVAFNAIYEISQLLKAPTPQNVLIEYHKPLSAEDKIHLYIRESEIGFDAWLVSDKNVAAAMRWN